MPGSREPHYVWRYELQPRRAVAGALTGRAHAGALLRIGDGFACVHPWPELGDRPLEAQLEALAEGGTTRLVAQAHRCADADARARREGRSLFAGRSMPESHFSAGREPRRAPPGFQAIKVKCGSDLDLAARAIDASSDDGEVQVRLDGNAGSNRREFDRWARALARRLRERVDFFEDPYPYDLEGWCSSEWSAGFALAQDFETGDGWDGVRIAKPAREHVVPNPGWRTVVTSYLDHPLGQLWAAFVATDFPGEIHGLLTHRLFERDEFSERLGDDGPMLARPGGTGLGFDDLLELLPWKRLGA